MPLAASCRDLLAVGTLDRTVHEFFVLRTVDQLRHAILEVLLEHLRIVLDVVGLRCQVKLGIKPDLLGKRRTREFPVTEVVRLVQDQTVDQKYDGKAAEESAGKSE